ncbi:divalent-cation tolerance protein CutA [Candidatus Aerophobetes bacterium]|nr:divalent-cation tolerance protein CutA [Candidatus Aerophobetes bacterium]
MLEFVQVFTTTCKKEEAEEIARLLVEKRLAGCVQIAGPVFSIYRWEGKIEQTEEWLCIIKTEKSLYREVEEAVKASHSYKTPEIIATPVVAGSKDYLSWLQGELVPKR